MRRYTRGKGYRFRSRLEARWAVFFDTLGLKYQYESEGFDLGELGWYLPDFWLPELGLWVEIKPSKGNLYDWPEHQVFSLAELGLYEKYKDLIDNFVLLLGEPYADSQVDRYTNGRYTLYFHQGDSFAYVGYIFADDCYWWCECPVCHKIGIKYAGRAGRLCSCLTGNDKAYNTGTPRLIAAYLAARGARFEHGEKPLSRVPA